MDRVSCLGSQRLHNTDELQEQWLFGGMRESNETDDTFCFQ